jgi:hypothetical protein
MKGIEIQVGGGGKKPLMVAKVSDDGKSIAIKHRDGRESTIRVGPSEEINLAGPSVDGRVMYVEVADGQNGFQNRFYDTISGERFKRKRGYNPQFYT